MPESDRLIVCDTETTGFEPESAVLLEVAAAGVDFGWSHMVEYDGVIPPDAKATHHIIEDSVRPGADNVYPRADVVDRLKLYADEKVFVFHNAAFDLLFLPEVRDYPVICTYRCALHLYPDAPSHKNQTLRYWLGVEPRPELIEGLHPHRALYDVACTLAIAEKMLETNTVDDLLRLTAEPVLLTTVRFGKHKGQLWTDVPRDYLRWMQRSGNWDKDVDVTYTLDVLTGRKVA